MGPVHLGGAYSGWFNVYSIEVRIPRLDFAAAVPVVAVPRVPDGSDGIACFKFLNRFHYGNFGERPRPRIWTPRGRSGAIRPSGPGPTHSPRAGLAPTLPFPASRRRGWVRESGDPSQPTS